MSLKSRIVDVPACMCPFNKVYFTLHLAPICLNKQELKQLVSYVTVHFEANSLTATVVTLHPLHAVNCSTLTHRHSSSFEGVYCLMNFVTLKNLQFFKKI